LLLYKNISEGKAIDFKIDEQKSLKKG